MTRTVAFLFLGETLLIPHLFPIVEALARTNDVSIDLWVSTSVHEGLLAGWTDPARIRIRRAPGFRTVPDDLTGRNPPLPAKLPMLASLIPHLWSVPVAVCAEQTSLWLPTLLPFLPTRFVKAAHGAGSMSARADRRRRSATLTLVPAERERAALAAHGVDPATIRPIGYVKSAFRQRTLARTLFADRKPILLYAPHWQARRSSWPSWGRAVVRLLVEQRRYNVILAPHQRLTETAPELRGVLDDVAGLPHVHVDLDSFAMVDGSYTAAADIYLGDTSSQVVEYLQRPRPCVFLNAHRVDWRGDPAYAQWQAGEVVDRLADLLPALDRAPSIHTDFAPWQQAFATEMLGDVSGAAPDRAAALIAGLLSS